MFSSKGYWIISLKHILRV